MSVPSAGWVEQVTGRPSLGELPANRVMSILRARCIARYRLHTPPGRPEELAQNTLVVTEPSSPNPDREYPGKVISFGYIHGSIRVRQHGGDRNREWVDHIDLRTDDDGWLNEAYSYLDRFFGYPSPATILARPIPA